MIENTPIEKKNPVEAAAFLNGLPWKDARLLYTLLRHRQGENDLVLVLEIPGLVEDPSEGPVELTLHGCWRGQCAAHWGPLEKAAPESIFEVRIDIDGPLLRKVIALWPDLHDQEVAEFRLDTDPSGSTVEAVFGSMSLRFLGAEGTPPKTV